MTPNTHIEVAKVFDAWQAVFACQVCQIPPKEWETLKWGFNIGALLTEALDRQKLFIESQYTGHVYQEEAPDRHTLALRCTHRPGQLPILALLGKVSAASSEAARASAELYCREITSTFPFDYTIRPAASALEFDRLSGKDILAQCREPHALAQIMRYEQQQYTRKNLAYAIGFWQTTERADEQIWRAVAGYPFPVALNVSLRPAFFSYQERQALWNMTQVSPENPPLPPNENGYQPYDQWIEPLINKRLHPYKKFYYTQVHLASPNGIAGTLSRPIGAAITRETQDLLSPGFIVRTLADLSDARKWLSALTWLEILPSMVNSTRIQRLSDIADLGETHSVFRFPLQLRPDITQIKFECPPATKEE
ncbi:MAG: hypothetical protein EHM81_07775 [Chloroflexi bacterium]|nr:MAG: hypothetical protein EHM81_07775 [Chloroflexota bacterium]